ncbi:hypothetical protein Zm00014a_036718 [Zea mays]|uniref:KOW domain-containing protein n=1 Tax=Zea mays TaxID=4577 RepID=A0A3L6EP07_MAIZE|nr:hypothetical protein Zm00014a_036718 [Zea mays]
MASRRHATPSNGNDYLPMDIVELSSDHLIENKPLLLKDVKFQKVHGLTSAYRPLFVRDTTFANGEQKTPSGSARQPLQLTNDVTKMMQKHQLETPQFHQTRFSVLLNVPRSTEKFYFHVVAGIHLRDVSFLIPHSWLPAMLDDQMSFPSLRQTRTTGCFRLHPIRDEDAKFKLCNGMSVQFDVGNMVMVTGGRNTGRVGVIKNWEKHKGIFEENIEWNSNLVVAKVWRLEFI